MIFADRLRALRAEKSWTQYAAARAYRMSQATRAKLEDSPSANPGTDVLRRLSMGLGVPLGFHAGHGSILPDENHDAGRPKHTGSVPIVGVAASHSAVDSEDLREEYLLLHHVYRSGRYAIRLFWDSTWPTLWTGDLLLAEPVDHVPNGRIAVVKANGESTVKWVHRRKKDGSWTLKSDDITWPLIEAEPDEAEIVARFLKIVEGDRQ